MKPLKFIAVFILMLIGGCSNEIGVEVTYNDGYVDTISGKSITDYSLCEERKCICAGSHHKVIACDVKRFKVIPNKEQE